MEQSPFIGYLKVAAFSILALFVFLAFWQRTKMEDRLGNLDTAVAGIQTRINEMSGELRESARESEKLRGANEALLKLLASGGLRVAPGGASDGGSAPDQATVPDLGLGGDEDEYGWKRNAALDADLDPSRPVGTPGRYRNFLTPDPAGPEAPPAPPNLTGTITLPWSSEPKGFNFLLENYATLSDEVQTYVLDSPASRHWHDPSSFNWKPALCWRVEVSPDYKEYTLFFRKDATWHPPPPDVDVRKYPHLQGKHAVTARDLEFTFKLILDPQSNLAVTRSYYDELKDAEAIDDHTAVIRWNKTQFNSLSWSIGCYILPEHIYARDQNGSRYPEETMGQEFNDHWFDQLRAGPVGSGPYRFTKYEPNKYIRMERWDDWYGFKDEPVFPVRVRDMRIYEEPNTQMNWLRTGEVDIGGLDATHWRQWVLEETDPKSPFKDGRIRTYVAPRTSYLYFGWKNTDPLFSDKRVRHALTYACDRFYICDKIFLNRYLPMSSPVYPESKEADKELKPYPFDLDKARALLDQAGWKINADTGLREKTIDGQVVPLEFKLYWPGPSPEFQDALDHYRNDLIKVGINMIPESRQWAQFQQDLRDRKFKAFSLLWVTPGWEHDFGQIWHSRGIQDPGSSNYIEFSNAELDALSDSLRDTMDPEERVKKVQRIGRILHEEQPYTFFAWAQVFRGYWSHVHNVEEKPYFIRPLLRTFPFYIDR